MATAKLKNPDEYYSDDGGYQAPDAANYGQGQVVNPTKNQSYAGPATSTDLRTQMHQSMLDINPYTGYYRTDKPLIDKYRDESRWLHDPIKWRSEQMMSDPSMRGYDQATKDKMFGRQADALAGAKTSFQKNINKYGSAMGYGGLSKKLGEYEKQHAANLRGAGIDTELADAEAKRSDLWNAMNQYQATIGSYLGNQAQSIDMAQKVWDSQMQTAMFDQQLKKQNPGFWERATKALLW